MSMADHDWFKARLIQKIEQMEPRRVLLVYRFIQGLSGKGRQNVPDTAKRRRIAWDNGC